MCGIYMRWIQHDAPGQIGVRLHDTGNGRKGGVIGKSEHRPRDRTAATARSGDKDLRPQFNAARPIGGTPAFVDKEVKHQQPVFPIHPPGGIDRQMQLVFTLGPDGCPVLSDAGPLGVLPGCAMPRRKWIALSENRATSPASVTRINPQSSISRCCTVINRALSGKAPHVSHPTSGSRAPHRA